MSDDLVKRLRICAAFDPDQAEAADRIEQLEAALREIKALHHADGIDDLQERDDKTYNIVCDALEKNNGE